MFHRLKSIFSNVKFSPGAPPPVCTDEAFLNDLAERNIFIIAATQSEGIDASTLTQDKLLAEIRSALERDREQAPRGYAAFTYLVDGQRRLPFFTSYECAQVFVGEYSKERNRVYPFMVLEVSGKLLGRMVESDCDIVVMNDKNPDERILTETECNAARQR